MSTEKWNDVRKILRDDRLEFHVTCNTDMLCTICQNILINPHNGPCGCRYCLDCITGYLNGEDKICPGNTDECKLVLLNMNNKILNDQPMNQKILKMIVQCPEKNCEFKEELRNIEDHIRICDSRPIDCPYLNMGCKDSKIVSVYMKDHMVAEIVSHTKMLFEQIDNFKNELQVLKDENVSLKRNNDDLEKFIYGNMDIKEKPRNNNFSEEQKSVNELKNEIKIMKTATDSMKTKTSANEKCINDLQVKYEKENKEGKEKLKEVEIRLLKEQRKNVNDLKNDLKMMKRKTELIKKNTSQNTDNSFWTILLVIILAYFGYDFFCKKYINEMSVLQKNQEQQNYGEFIWKIDKFIEKIEQAQEGKITSIFSDAFYSHKNGYKLCLCIHPIGSGYSKGTHLSVSFYLMRGEFDEILSWPFQFDVTFELINQYTRQIHKNGTINHLDLPKSKAFQRPTADINEKGFGFGKFISLEELLNDFSLIVNDKIFIRCRVKIN